VRRAAEDQNSCIILEPADFNPFLKMSEITNGYKPANGYDTTNGYASENGCCVTNGLSSIKGYPGKNGYSSAYSYYKHNRFMDDDILR
jgi:hypothetical protein